MSTATPLPPPDLFGDREWTQDDTCAWLDDHPLPLGFAWRDKPVHPSYTLKKGYGFWLKTTPYHPGLYEAIHEMHVNTPYLVPADEILRRLREIETHRKAQTAFSF